MGSGPARDLPDIQMSPVAPFFVEMKMRAPQIRFQDPDDPAREVAVEADPQAAVTPGERPGTATITLPDGQQLRVSGDYLDVHVRLQAAAARGHESGAARQPNTPVS